MSKRVGRDRGREREREREREKERERERERHYFVSILEHTKITLVQDE